MIRTADGAIAELIKLGWKIPESVNVADFIRMQEEQIERNPSMQIHDAVLKVWPNRFWSKAELWIDGHKIHGLNCYWDISMNWITEYEVVGGHDTHRKGNGVVWKHYIGDCNFHVEECWDTPSL